MNDYTTKPISLELERVGFSEIDEHVQPCHDDGTSRYSASALFEWLRGKYNSTPSLALDIQTTEITIWLNIGHNPNEEEKEFEYKTNLADMLASAIIWILKEEDDE